MNTYVNIAFLITTALLAACAIPLVLLADPVWAFRSLAVAVMVGLIGVMMRLMPLMWADT